MKVSVASGLILSLCIVLFPIVQAQDVKCNRSGTQLEMNRCAFDDFVAADNDLNQVYQSVLNKRGDDNTFIDKLRKSQRAWISFRDAELEATYACAEVHEQMCWGSIFPMLYSGYKAELTRQRTARLRRYLEDADAAGWGY